MSADLQISLTFGVHFVPIRFWDPGCHIYELDSEIAVYHILMSSRVTTQVSHDTAIQAGAKIMETQQNLTK